MLLPLLDPGHLRWDTAGRAGLAVLAFVAASAAIYVTNDIVDRERDRAHVGKRHRPVASGRVSPWTAGGLATVLVLALAVLVAPSAAHWWPLPAYLLLNVAYSFALKHVPLVDLFAVASGFVLRLVQGYVAIQARPSGWLALCVLCVCLLLILGKRRHELRVAGPAHRPALTGYNEYFLDQLLVLTAGVTFVTYLLHVTAFSPTALFTAPCALFALFRYMQVVLVRAGGGNPVRVLLRDRVMIANAVLWVTILEGGALHG